MKQWLLTRRVLANCVATFTRLTLHGEATEIGELAAACGQRAPPVHGSKLGNDAAIDMYLSKGTDTVYAIDCSGGSTRQAAEELATSASADRISLRARPSVSLAPSSHCAVTRGGGGLMIMDGFIRWMDDVEISFALL